MNTRILPWRIPSAFALAAAAATLALTALAGCSDPEDDVPQVPRAEASTTVDGYGQRVLNTLGEILGAPATVNTRDIGPNPCDGRRGEISDTVYSMHAGYQVNVPTDQQLDALRQLRERWQQQGYEVTTDRTFAENRGEVVVRNPVDSITIAVISTNPPTAYSITISTPCYQGEREPA